MVGECLGLLGCLVRVVLVPHFAKLYGPSVHIDWLIPCLNIKKITHWTDKKTYYYLLTCSMNGCNQQLKTNPSTGDDLNIQAFVRAQGWYLPHRKKRKWKVVLCPFHRAQLEEEDFREEMKQSQASVP